MAASIGLLSLIRRLAASAIAALTALALTVALMAFLAWQSSLLVRRTRQVQFAGARALDLALDWQTSINSYLITADTSVLALERSARPALEATLDSLAVLTSDNPVQQAHLQLVSSAIRSWDSAYASRILDARDSAGRARLGRDSKAGAVEFAMVRQRIEEFLDEEASQYARRMQRTTIWRWAEVVVVTLEALLVIVVLMQMRRALVRQADETLERQTQLEDQAVELEAQAAEQEILTAELTAANIEQESLTADLELANHELTELAVEAEEARDQAVRLEERYRLLFDRNPAPMWVFDEETLRFLAVNEAALLQYGYSKDEFLSMTLEDIRPPEDIERLRKNARPAEPALRQSRGWRHRRKDGSLIRVDIVAHGVEFEGRRARIVLAIDVTSRETAQEALAESSGILSAVFDDSPLAIVVFTPDLIIHRWNRAAESQFGWSAEEAIGASLFTIIPEERRQESVEMRRRLEDGAVITNFATQRRRRDGTVREVQISKCRLHSVDGNLAGFVSIISDETERKRLEAQFRQAQKMEAVGQLAGGIAHDFNNLLTVIISYSQMLLGEIPESSTSRGDVQEIKRAAERAALLTKQLLAFSRQQVLRPQTLDLNLVIGELEQMLRRLVREDIGIALSLDPALGSVAADPGQVEQIVMNLVVNARDAMPNGGRIAIETANVEFESAYQLRESETPLEAGAYVMLAVSDNGTGMTPEVQARAFEPFFTTKRLHEGTGLGLSTVYGIVKQSGGHLAMYSEPGEGTIFKIYLPRIDSTINPNDSEDGASAATSSGGEVVLIVEDDDALRIVASRVLRQCGYVMLEASNGQEALEQCKAHEGALHLVITDMVMPEMSGMELAGYIADRYPEVRVLLMSGYTRDEAARRGIASERYAFLEKPFTPTKLASAVRELLDGLRSRGRGIATA